MKTLASVLILVESTNPRSRAEISTFQGMGETPLAFVLRVPIVCPETRSAVGHGVAVASLFLVLKRIIDES